MSKLACPVCKYTKLRVSHTESTAVNIYRLRHCDKCSLRIETNEIITAVYEKVALGGRAVRHINYKPRCYKKKRKK